MAQKAWQELSLAHGPPEGDSHPGFQLAHGLPEGHGHPGFPPAHESPEGHGHPGFQPPSDMSIIQTPDGRPMVMANF